MEFLCDVHISRKLVVFLNQNQFSSKHVNDLPLKWNTSDLEICKYADENNLVIITKDVDFRNSYFINNNPQKLIRVLLGNISNVELIEIFNKYLSTILIYKEHKRFYIELDRDGLFVIDG